MMKGLHGKRMFSAALVLLVMLTIALPINAATGMDRPINSIGYSSNARFVIFMGSIPTQPQAGDYCLNQLTNNTPISGTNLTIAKYNPNSSGSNPTQEFVRVKLYTNGGIKYGWGCASNPSLLMYNRFTEGNYVNVQPYNYKLSTGVQPGYGRFDAHNGVCLAQQIPDLGQTTTRDFIYIYNGGYAMVICETGVPAYGSTNRYLCWRSLDGYVDEACAAVPFYKTGSTSFTRYNTCPHSFN